MHERGRAGYTLGMWFSNFTFCSHQTSVVCSHLIDEILSRDSWVRFTVTFTALKIQYISWRWAVKIWSNITLAACSNFGHLISCYGCYTTTFISPARLWPVSTETTSTMMSSQWRSQLKIQYITWCWAVDMSEFIITAVRPAVLVV